MNDRRATIVALPLLGNDPNNAAAMLSHLGRQKTDNVVEKENTQAVRDNEPALHMVDPQQKKKQGNEEAYPSPSRMNY